MIEYDIMENMEKEFLHSLFYKLNNLKVKYAVLRNYETLPENTNGSDIDICFFDDEGVAIKALQDAMVVCGGAVIGVVSSPGFTQFAVIGKYKKSGLLWWGQLIDVSSSTYKGLPIASLEELGKHIKNYNGVSVLSKNVSSANALIKTILSHGDINEKYLKEYMEAGGVEKNVYDRIFSPLGCRANIYLRDIIETYNGKVDFYKVIKARLAVHLHAMRKNIIDYIRNRFLFEYSRIERLYNPVGIVVGILGTDGSGKSTVIHAIRPVLESATHGAFYVEHLRPTLLPPLARLKGKTSGVQGPVTDPHGSKPSGVPGSLFRLAYLVADYVMGYWIKVRPRIAKSPAIVLFDRYAYDLEMDPRRFRIKLPKWLLHLATKMAPKPDLIFCLDGEAEEIQRRKQELPLEEVERQLAFIREFAANHPNAVLISTRGTVEETREQVLDALRQYCLERNPLNELS